MTSISQTIHFKWELNKIVPLGPLEIHDEELPFPNGFFQMHRLLEKAYQPLPWPAEIKQIAILTYAEGGRGDVSAAAKVISLMQRMCPDLIFDWVIRGMEQNIDPSSFLNHCDMSKIKIRKWDTKSTESAPADLLIVGPTVCTDSLDYIKSKINRSVQRKQIFGFLEIGKIPLYQDSLGIFKKQIDETSDYRVLHNGVFPCSSQILPIGLIAGTGLFQDESRITAPLSREHCCPAYLLQLEDLSLKQDILNTVGIEPDYNKYSMNFGYAHISRSWERFIDFVSVHEQEKHIVIVLNQIGAFDQYTTSKFLETILTSERLEFLGKWGYGKVILKGNENELFTLNTSAGKEKRDFTIILRPSFHFADVRRLQLASERLLATGDNTPPESWASKCILYLYENIDDKLGGTRKTRFTKQQVGVATTISPYLGELIDLGAKKTPLTPDEMARAVTILQDPTLSRSTLEFCNVATSQYSFIPVLEGSLKRIAWNQVLPGLLQAEAEAIEPAVKTRVVQFLQNLDSSPQVIQINTVEIATRIRQKVETHLT